jgi:cation:H+ antiporter
MGGPLGTAVEPAAVAFAVGAVVCLGTSWVLVAKLEMVGERFGFSEALLGLVAALAADTPEITAAVTALSRHERAVGAGVVVGSNVFNLAALLGLGAVVAGRLDLHRKVVLLGGAVAVWMAAVCLVTVTRVVSPDFGLVLVLAVLVTYTGVLAGRRALLRRLALPKSWVRWLASAVDEEELELVVAIRPKRARPLDTLVAAIALGVVVGSAVAMERGASTLGRHYAVPGVIVGGLVLAAVTSLPNAVAAVYLASKGRGAAAFSTALNSNTLNVVAGLVLPATVLGLTRPSGQTVFVAGTYMGLTALTLALAYFGRGLRRGAGLVIVVGYAAFVATLVAVS